MKENPKIRRWELSLSTMGMVHLHYETLLLNILQDGMGGLARELHQLADAQALAWWKTAGHDHCCNHRGVGGKDLALTQKMKDNSQGQMR